MKEKQKVEVTLRRLYKEYSRNQIKKGRKVLSYLIYARCVNDLTLKIRDYILDGNTMYLPFNLGTLQVVKSKRRFERLRAVDWKKTKELGYKVYHEDPYSYYWFWDKFKSNVKYKSRYKFISCRTANRLIAEYRSKNKDYYFKRSK